MLHHKFMCLTFKRLNVFKFYTANIVVINLVVTNETFVNSITLHNFKQVLKRFAQQNQINLVVTNKRHKFTKT